MQKTKKKGGGRVIILGMLIITLLIVIPKLPMLQSSGIETIKVAETSQTVVLGDFTTMKMTLTPGDISRDDYEIKVEDKSVIEVQTQDIKNKDDETKLTLIIYGLAEGKTSFVVRSSKDSSIESESISVEVKHRPVVKSIKLSETEFAMQAGESKEITAHIQEAGITAEDMYIISDDDSIIEITDETIDYTEDETLVKFMVRANAEGTGYISVSSSDDEVQKIITVKVTE